MFKNQEDDSVDNCVIKDVKCRHSMLFFKFLNVKVFYLQYKYNINNNVATPFIDYFSHYSTFKVSSMNRQYTFPKF